MPSNRPTSADPIRRTLDGFHTCGWTCGTCGGHPGKVSRLLRDCRRDPRRYLAELATLGAEDFSRIGHTAPLVRAALDVVPSPLDRARVLDEWARTAESHPDVALIALHAAGPHLQLSTRLIAVLIALSRSRSVLAEHLATALGPLALAYPHLSWDARRSIERAMNELVGWERLQLDADERERQSIERARLARAEDERRRLAEIGRLQALPLHERLAALEGAGMAPQLLADSLAAATQEELSALSPDVALSDARLIKRSLGPPWQELKRRLLLVHADSQLSQQRARAQRRLEEIADIESCSAQERLRRVARSHRPIDYWPAEWATVDETAIQALGLEERARLSLLIGRQLRRVRNSTDRKQWRELRDRL